MYTQRERSKRERGRGTDRRRQQRAPLLPGYPAEMSSPGGEEGSRGGGQACGPEPPPPGHPAERAVVRPVDGVPPAMRDLLGPLALVTDQALPALGVVVAVPLALEADGPSVSEASALPQGSELLLLHGSFRVGSCSGGEGSDLGLLGQEHAVLVRGGEAESGHEPDRIGQEGAHLQGHAPGGGGGDRHLHYDLSLAEGIGMAGAGDPGRARGRGDSGLGRPLPIGGENLAVVERYGRQAEGPGDVLPLVAGKAEEEALEGDLGAALGSRQPDVVGAACLDDDGTSLLRAAFPLGGGLGFGLGEPPRVAIDKTNPVRGGAYVRSAWRTSAASRNRLHRFALEADETLVALERRKI